MGKAEGGDDAGDDEGRGQASSVWSGAGRAKAEAIRAPVRLVKT